MFNIISGDHKQRSNIFERYIKSSDIVSKSDLLSKLGTLAAKLVEHRDNLTLLNSSDGEIWSSPNNITETEKIPTIILGEMATRLIIKNPNQIGLTSRQRENIVSHNSYISDELLRTVESQSNSRDSEILNSNDKRSFSARVVTKSKLFPVLRPILCITEDKKEPNMLDKTVILYHELAHVEQNISANNLTCNMSLSMEDWRLTTELEAYHVSAMVGSLINDSYPGYKDISMEIDRIRLSTLSDPNTKYPFAPSSAIKNALIDKNLDCIYRTRS